MAVENTVEILAFMWKRISRRWFSTFPQGGNLTHLWKCGKLTFKPMFLKNLVINRSVEIFATGN
jgi:hypothetical protein